MKLDLTKAYANSRFVMYIISQQTILKAYPIMYPRAGGGALPLEGGTGMCHGHDPLFSGQLALPSLPISHQCAAHVPQFSKICIFSLVFGQKGQNF